MMSTSESFAVSMMIGTFEDMRICLHTSVPGMPGSMRSSSTRSGWVLRNVGARPATYREVLRLLKPGGRFLCLDMSRPSFWPLRVGSDLYLRLVMKTMACVSSGDASAYEYLIRSTQKFPGKEALADEMRQAGFAPVETWTYMGGGVAAHLATKAGA